jgi:hypothetical protein
METRARLCGGALSWHSAIRVGQTRPLPVRPLPGSVPRPPLTDALDPFDPQNRPPDQSSLRKVFLPDCLGPQRKDVSVPGSGSGKALLKFEIVSFDLFCMETGGRRPKKAP